MESFIDSHAHLADRAFDGDRHEVIARAVAANAAAIICIGESLERARDSAALARDFPGLLYSTAGIHPHDAASFRAPDDIPALRTLLQAGAVAVGECGLDYHYDNSPRDAQRRAFAAQLELAGELGKPVIVHTRDAEADTGDMIRDAAAQRIAGVLHCFTGSPELAQIALDAGWYVSFSGIATFRRWDRDDVVRLVPDDRLLAESDSPYLAPVPHRGKRNEPAWVPVTIARLAAARAQSADQVARYTSANAARLFALAPDTPH